MASVNTEIVALAARARRIGWPVEVGSKGEEWRYRITRPDGFRVQLHASPSGTNWMAGAMRQLNDGQKKLFDKAEAARLDANERRRKRKLADDKEAGARKLAAAEKLAQTREAAVTRAAGPLAVVEFDHAWLFTPHPIPEYRHGILTPETAAKLLDSVDRTRENRHQRAYRQQRERYFADQIDAGLMADTHQGMAIDSDGNFQDGQHRAGAIVLTGMPQPVWLAVGMPPEFFTKLDAPLVRTARDALDIRGETNVGILASAIRLITLFDKYGQDLINKRSTTKVTADTIDKFMLSESGQPLREAAARCVEIRREIKIVASALTAALYLIRRDAGRSGDDSRVSQFFEDIEIGIPDKQDVVYRLRRILNDTSRGRPDQYVTLALIIKVWNARITGRALRHLSWRRDEPFPGTIIVPAPEENRQ